MNDKINAAISKYAMLSRGDSVVAGLSGGADSVCLLHFLCAVRQESGISVFAAHINHNLRGAESGRDEAFVRAYCERLGVALTVRSMDIGAMAARAGKSVEETAREARYAAFAELAGDTGKIATAHTLSDSVETLLINLARGTGVKGLTGIPPVRGNIIRPLIFCERRDVEAYCAFHRLEYVTDSSNLTDDYARNRVRRHAVPALEAVNPAFQRSAERAMTLLRGDMDYLETLADEAFLDLSRGEALDCKGLSGLPVPISSRVVAKLFRGRGIFFSAARAERALALALAGTGAEDLSGKYTLRVRRGLLVIEEKSGDALYFEHEIDVGKLRESVFLTLTEGKILKLTPVSREDFDYISKTDGNYLKNVLDCDKIGRIIKFRQRLPADSIRLKGRGCTKSLKKLYNESGIPAGLRGQLAVAAGDEAGRLLWAEGFGVSEKAGADTGTVRGLYMETLERQSEISV